jgi:hypothetical protein
MKIGFRQHVGTYLTSFITQLTSKFYLYVDYFAALRHALEDGKFFLDFVSISNLEWSLFVVGIDLLG